MTHFNTNLRLPVRTGPSPMEDLIVQQVEWYMGRLNLEKDEYLKEQMDDELWVSLDIILNFPKMQRLGVQDKRRVATLLHARSTIVEVDEKAARIRPAWARRSTIVIHNVPTNARLDQITALLQIPSNADITNAHVPPTVTHPQGLISIQPAGETIWLAIFDSPTGAHDSVHLLVDKEINAQKVNPEVLVENSLRPNTAYRHPDAHSPVFNNARPVDQQNSTAYAQAIPVMSTGMMTNQMMNPMGMPMPVIHHPSQEAHPQYTYAPPPTGYAPGYPQNMPVPRQFIGAPRGIHTGYVMTYPQAEHPYDPSHAVLPTHQIRPQQPQVDQNGAPIITQPPIPAEGATAGQGVQTVPIVPNGVQAPPSGDGAEPETAEIVQDAGIISQVQADAQRITAQIPYAPPVQNPVLPGQPIDGQMMPVKPVDMHYMHRPQMMGDPNMYTRGNGRQPGMGRDRGQRNADGSMRASRGSTVDGQRPGMHRKGKKGNRGGGRHSHSHDRDRRDGKGDGSSSDSGNRDDRSFKNKPEPNLASMHFPPLPMSENAGVRVPPKMVLKKEESGEKPTPPTAAKEIKECGSDGTIETPAPAETKAESVGSESENAAAPQENASEKESTPKESSETPAQKTDDSGNGEDVAKVAESSNEAKEEALAVEDEKKTEAKTPVVPAASPMSYAAILRSKKPSPPPRPAQPPVSRSSSGASGKNTDNSSGSEANSSAASQPPKEKGGRRRKSNNSRNNHIGDTKDSGSTSNGSKSEKHVEKKGSEAAPAAAAAPVPAELKESNSGGGEGARSKQVVENTRAHSVWANKPKSLFQAASAAPTARASNPQASVDAKKISSPVSSLGDEKEAGLEKSTKEANSRATPNGKANGTVAPRSTKEESNDVKANGTMDTKDAVEKPAQKSVSSSKGSSESTKTGKGSKGADKAATVSAKGAWAAGGPKAWPKNGANGVMEKMSNTTES